MAIDVLHGGLLTTVQDGGRYGLYDQGFPPSGAMDQFAFRVGNLLVGNDDEAAAFEATYLGPRLRFRDRRVVAVTGADIPIRLDGDEQPGWTSFEVQEGQTLTFEPLRGGARAYIAVSGGIDEPLVLGSRSTYARVSLGGHDGRALREGDVVPLGGCEPAAWRMVGMSVPDRFRPSFAKEVEVRVVIGLYSHRLTDRSLAEFLAVDWTVTTDADRVGYRYRAIELEFEPRDEMPFGAGSAPWNTCSLNYPFGVIQLPGGVEPIVLMRDGVTGGNYASVGTVISADLDLVAQSRSHDRTRFHAVSMDQALTARAERRSRLGEIRAHLVR